MITAADPTLLFHLRDEEEFKAHPYLDTQGIQTIGYGRNLVAVGLRKDEAEYMLRNDVREALKYVSLYSFWPALNDCRQRVILEMCFQLGPATFRQFAGMLSALDKGDYSLAAQHMIDSLWGTQTHARVLRLSDRMRTGIDNAPEVRPQDDPKLPQV